MTRPVVHTKFGNLAITRAKLLLIETMAADPRLKPRELRVGIALVSSYSTSNGCGDPSMEYVGRSLGIDDSAVCKAARGLEQKGYLQIDHGRYLFQGRGQRNRYYPNWDKVPSLVPLNDAAMSRKAVNLTSFGDAAETDSETQKTVNPTQKRLSNSPILPSSSFHTSCAPQRTSPSGDVHAPSAIVSFQQEGDVSDRQQCGQWVRQVDEATKAGAFVPDEDTMATFDAICDVHDSHTGDPLGGSAYRVGDDVAAYLPDEEFEPDDPIAPAPEPDPESEPEETPVNGHAIAEPIQFDAPTKPQWRKPTYVEVLDPQRYPKGRKFASWFAEQRSARGVQLAAVAQAVGLSPADWWRVETGQSEIGQAMQRQAIAALMERAA
jgi:hypothetical protein